MNNLIQIIGNVASGKSTLAKKLAKEMDGSYIDIDLYKKNPFLASGDPNLSFEIGLHFSFQRSKRIPLVVKTLKTKDVVLDQGFDMGFYTYTKNHFIKKRMTKEQWVFLQELHRYFMKDAPKVSTTILLDIPTPVIMERIKKRGREHELKFYSEEFVKELSERLKEFVSDLKKNKQTLIILNGKTKKVQVIGKPNQKIVQYIIGLWKMEE